MRFSKDGHLSAIGHSIMSKEKDNKELGEELIKGIFNTIRQPALLMIEENKEQNKIFEY